MTATPLDRIASMLTDAGYLRLDTPLDIRGLPFDIPLAFVGPVPSPDLVLVADTAFEDGRRILRKLEGVARALDIAGSKRSLTAVLAGPRPNSAVLGAMGRVCRVLPVGTTGGTNPEDGLRNWLAVLLPLELPVPGDGIADPVGEFSGRIGDLDADIAELFELAAYGEARVRDRLIALVSEPADGIEAGDRP